MKVNIIPSILLIGTVTFIFSVFGVWLGNGFGEKYCSKAELAGGIILIYGYKDIAYPCGGYWIEAKGGNGMADSNITKKHLRQRCGSLWRKFPSIKYG